MNRTSIEWTDFTANPIKFRDADGRVVWHCEKLSPGCKNCYAEALSHRYGGIRRAGEWNASTTKTLTPFLDEAELHKMRTAKVIGGKQVSGGRCFIGDMTDIFGEWVSDDILNRLFSQTLELRTDVTWQILTKRADRLERYLSWRWGNGRIPSRHIHIGVSCEDQQRADERIPLLLETPAAIRFVSYEPALGPIDIRKWMASYDSVREHGTFGKVVVRKRPGFDWLIAGGESGPGARPPEMGWFTSVQEQIECSMGATKLFMKQVGPYPVDVARPSGVSETEAQRWMREGWTRVTTGQGTFFTKHPRITDSKGGNPSEWPEKLRVRQFPTTEARP